jgi:ferritin
MLSKKIAEELNRQLNMEIQSAYSYFAMAAHCNGINMDGSAKWMLIQGKEELTHGMKIYQYLVDQDAAVNLLAVPQPKTSYSSLLEVFKKAMEHEVAVQTSINEIASAALAEKDNTTYGFLHWFLEEQVEEVSNCAKVINRLELAGNDPRGVMILDGELGRRAE